jgi:hypothetical protein
MTTAAQSLWAVVTPLLVVSAAVAVSAGVSSPAERVLMQWEFDRDGDLEGWAPNSHLRDTTVAGGVLTTTVIDRDPILEHPVFEAPLPATPRQVLEVRLNAPVEGTAEFFWTNTTETQYGGFSPGKETPFEVRPGWQVYRVRPFWQAEGRIIKLRLDLPPVKQEGEAQTYQIDYIRIIELAPAAEAAESKWDFDRDAEGWQVEGEGRAQAAGGWLLADLQPGARLVAPPVSINAAEDLFVSFSMATSGGDYGRLCWASTKTNGLHHQDFPLLADGKPHVYNVPLGLHPDWQGTVIYLALEPLGGRGGEARLDWLRTSPEPVGPAELEVQQFMVADALPRSGRPCEVTARLANRGGQALQNLRAELILPPGVRLAAGEQAVKTVLFLDYYETQELGWQVIATRPGLAAFELKLSGPVSASARTSERFLPDLKLPKADYVPEPKPVRGEYEVGVYYFPGWGRWGSWEPIARFPERRPVLGWYQEGSPEVADWHIKWAVEHGITFFCYDWYWTQGLRRLEHALHQGYFQARYRHLLKFCLLWANHFGPGEHSPEDNVRVCQYWLDNYLRRPEYFKIGGRPLLVIFSVHSLYRDLGIEGTRQAIELWHRMTREAGVGELLVAGCGWPANLAQMKEMGFDAVTGYNWPSCGVEGRNFVPYIEVARKQFDLWWMPMAQAKLMPVLVPTSPGWDARPWHGARAFVLTDRTPQAFEEHLRLAKRFVEETGQPKVVLVEAWNEWGEGSYCEPHKEFGFGHLDAVRRVFCPGAPPHVDYGPLDVGRPAPVLTPPKEQKTAWEFDTEGDSEGWGPMMGLRDFQVTGGCMRARTYNRDPAFSAPVHLRAQRFPVLEIRMAVSRAREGDQLQVFWSTPFSATSEPASVRVPLIGDGQMHVYRLEVGANPRWRGLITGLRLDPGSTEDVEVKVDYVRALPAGAGG